MEYVQLPKIIQSVGLACVPLHDMPPGEPVSRRPVAAAVVTLKPNMSGGYVADVAAMSDARDTEFPLPWLINEALADDVPTIISSNDRATLAADAMARRFFAEPRLARLCRGEGAIDPVPLGMGEVDEQSLCGRLLIPSVVPSDREIELAWSRHAPEAAEGAASITAIARLMLWSHGQAFAQGEPDPFYETMLSLNGWMTGQDKLPASLEQIMRSRPMRRAVSFARTYRSYRDRRDAGAVAPWITFEDGLFHT